MTKMFPKKPPDPPNKTTKVIQASKKVTSVY